MIVKGFIVLMGLSKNRQIKKQAKKCIPVKADLHHILLAQQPEGSGSGGGGWAVGCIRAIMIKVREECIVLFGHTLYEKMN